LDTSLLTNPQTIFETRMREWQCGGEEQCACEEREAIEKGKGEWV